MTEALEYIAQIVPEAGMAQRLAHRLDNERQRLIEPARPRIEHAQQMEGIGMVGLLPQAFSAEGRRRLGRPARSWERASQSMLSRESGTSNLVRSEAYAASIYVA